MFTLKIGSHLVEINSVKDLTGVVSDENALACFLTRLSNAYYDAAEYHFNHGRDGTGNALMKNVHDIWDSTNLLYK